MMYQKTTGEIKVEMLNKGRAYKRELESRTCSRIEKNAEGFNT